MIKPSEFQGKFLIGGKIHCDTGLHIGATDEGIEIGGVDNAVIKDPLTDRPYIPGSSLKGKLRATMEWSLGLIRKHSKHDGFAAYECPELKQSRDESPDPQRWENAYVVARLFGPSTDDETIRTQAGPTRLTVRDAFMNDETTEELQRILGDGVFTEIKTENALDRVTSAANPRPVERVPAGADFDFTLIVDIYQEEDRDLLRYLFGALAMLEDGGIGGGVSRGHGQVAFTELSVEWRSSSYYTEGEGPQTINGVKDKTVREIAAEFDVSKWE